MSIVDKLLSVTPTVRVHDSGLIPEDASPWNTCQASGISRDLPLAVISDSAEIVAIDLVTGEMERNELRGEWGVKAIVGLPGREFMLVSICDIRAGEFSQMATGMYSRLWEIKSGGSVLGAAATPDLSRWAVAAGDRVWEGTIKRQKITSVVRKHKALNRYAVSMSSDGETLVVGGDGGVDVYIGQPPVKAEEYRFPDALDVPQLATGLSPDGGLIVMGDDITRTALIDRSTGEIRGLDTHGKAIAVDWTPDGEAFAVVTLTREIYVFDRTGKPLVHAGHPDSGTRYFTSGGFIPGGRGLWAGTEHGLIVTWMLE